MSNTDKKHASNFTKLMVGKTIKTIRYLTEEEANELMWYKRPLVIEFTDGGLLLPMTDDEGNDGGAMLYQDKTRDEVIYTIQ